MIWILNSHTERASLPPLYGLRSCRQGRNALPTSRLHRNTISQVIHRRPEAAPKAGRREAVNNLAAAVPTIPGKTVGGSRFAAASLRSAPPHPTRVESRKPTTPAARVQKSERTSPREGHRIRLTMNRVIPTSAAATQRKESRQMKTWKDITHFAGFDWAKDHHDVLVLDGAGKIVAEFRFDHTASGWALCQEKLAPFPAVAIAVEAGHSAAIERLVTLDYRVYPVHPRSSKSYRTRRLPSGTKTDRRDCWALADALRLEGESWRVLTTPEPLVQQLRLLCRDEVALIEQRTAFINQLQQASFTSIIPLRWRRSRIGARLRRGRSWNAFPRRKPWWKLENASGKTSCTHKSCFIQSGIKSGWDFCQG